MVDTATLPPSMRRPEQVADQLTAAMVSRVQFSDPAAPVHARLDSWDVGGVTVLRAALSGDLTLARSARQARADPAPAVSFAVQESGTARHEQFQAQRLVPSGALALTEVGSPYEFQWTGGGACRALQVPVSRLGLSVDAVRRAVPVAHRSPLYALVHGHLAQVTRDAAQLSRDPMAHAVAAATIDLTRALLASALSPGPDRDDALAQTLASQVRSYVRQHLTDPGLDVETIARAHAVSVRQLYRSCAAAGFSLEQWVIGQRLEGARTELAGPGGCDRSIAGVARRWGFPDPSHFSRRFRAAFGTTPREWRDAGRGKARVE
nr:helix-turn-helix domain-containing protein [Modestobacter marinus]